MTDVGTAAPDNTNESARQRSRLLPGWSLLLLLLVFLLTRGVGGWLVDHPDIYPGPGSGPVAGDVVIYEHWAQQLLRHDVAAYSGVGIEYPPGSLPFMALPLATRAPVGYRTGFIVVLVAVDAVGLAGMFALSRRLGGANPSSLGPWAWTLLIPLLGPIVWVRLDLVPAVATVWACVAVAGRQWFAAGGWLGFGAIAKVYPALLLPAVAVVSDRRRALIGGAALLMALPLLPFVPHLTDVFDSVAGYHARRGIQVESVWGWLLLVAAQLGYRVAGGFTFGAYHLESSVSGLLKLLSNVAAVGAVAWVSWLARPRAARGDPGTAIMAMLATLALLLVTGSVLSAQFVVWLLALACAALCVPGTSLRATLPLLALAAVLTQVMFPFNYGHVLGARWLGITILGVRNLALVGVAAIAVQALVRHVGWSPSGTRLGALSRLQ